MFEKKIRSLDGGWVFRMKEASDWYSARVPGNFHADLIRNGQIEDPCKVPNEKDIQWLDRKDWVYRLDFDLDDCFDPEEEVELVFEGLDTWSRIELNGIVLAETRNMFRSYCFSVKKELKEGSNRLEITFYSPVKSLQETIKKQGFSYPALYDDSAGGGLKKDKLSVFLRKAVFHFGSDSGPRMVTAGIWRPVYLRSRSCDALADVRIRTLSLGKKKALLQVEGRFRTPLTRACQVLFTPEEGTKPLRAGVKAGAESFKFKAEVVEPRLWWCNGRGLPHLYHGSVDLLVQETVLESRKIEYGIRTIELIQKRDVWGRSFTFRLNGESIFIKGAHHLPSSLFPGERTVERYRNEINSAALAHINLLRVWGGGFYENEEFYTCCDRAGILVWQDFMFAGSLYPDDPELLEEIKLEAEENVKRIASHPSLALWCGGEGFNALAYELKDSCWQESIPPEQLDRAEETRKKIFEGILPEVVSRFSPEISYIVSSPGDFESEWTNSLQGDRQYWKGWYEGEEFSAVRELKSRFLSSFGFPSFPEMRTIADFTHEGDWDLDSEVMITRQKTGRGNSWFEELILRDYRPPAGFQGMIYLSQLLQAESLKRTIESQRRHRPCCMGVLFRQLNSFYPAPGWATTDYFQRWKAAHYLVKKAYSDITAVPIIEKDYLAVALVSDRSKDAGLDLVLEILTIEGDVLWQSRIGVRVPARSSEIQIINRLIDIIEPERYSSAVLALKLEFEGRVLYRDTGLFVPMKELEIRKPHIVHSLVPAQDGYRLTLMTDVFAPRVEIETGLAFDFISDHYFDLFPGEIYTVDVFTREEIAPDSFCIRSMADFVKLD